ncbi:MAG: hypothetical protein KatS3mg004_1802 [Bryobacteraceae bacterium]|nr:MAG: hypothetical protein KatS3mg004_1802 [Bryobacteraceae bacterium]
MNELAGPGASPVGGERIQKKMRGTGSGDRVVLPLAGLVARPAQPACVRQAGSSILP